MKLEIQCQLQHTCNRMLLKYIREFSFNDVIFYFKIHIQVCGDYSGKI